MVGYLNAPSPFDTDGWMNTGDVVESDGEYVRILGRQSEIISVGGQRVVPIEVETILVQADNVIDATVYGTPNALMGASVAARVSLESDEDLSKLKTRLRKFCLARLVPYKVPVRFIVVPQSEQHSERAKKIRRVED
jgi:acyl-coenzyme A synthetase/AMP-(fatty) acid ligase